ncbi:MAG: hypothetical protein MAG431_01105 [Chloroflexi bacterium]|nr:hypothetical protein [Chloroflexota bacterium]
MKKIFSWVKGFFFPPAGTPLWLRLTPYIVLGILTLAVLISSAYAWEYTNSPEFCGTGCHTMPPEFTSYLTSPHARIKCVDCHIGEGFIATRISRKAGDAKHIISLVFQDYEYPIKAKKLRPARETCELCHFPEKFSDDSVREIESYQSDKENTPLTTYLVLKTGGGSKRLGLGRGIHWHIENPVYFYAEDRDEQSIPYVQVVEEDGTVTEYIDVQSDITPADINEEELIEMDCITCHNRITHLVSFPEDAIDKLLERGLVSPEIPEIRRIAVDLFYREHASKESALESLGLIPEYYAKNYPDFFEENEQSIREAVSELQDVYTNSVFPEQKSDWASHPNNVGHEFSPGCLRCHDGKHLNEKDEAIRLECNLCHSIPVVADQSDIVAEIEISRGPEPELHRNPNWISLHHEAFNATCANCHTTEDPGGTSNTSFCSNSACHGVAWEYAGFDAPELREKIIHLLPPSPTPTPIPEVAGPLTYTDNIGAILEGKCGMCHGEEGVEGLNLTTYATAMEGSNNGPVILPGNPGDSPLILETINGDHFAQFSEEELALIREWIENGASE